MHVTTYSDGGGPNGGMFGLRNIDTVSVGAVARSCYGETVYLHPVTLIDSKMLPRTIFERDATQLKAMAVHKL